MFVFFTPFQASVANLVNNNPGIAESGSQISGEPDLPTKRFQVATCVHSHGLQVMQIPSVQNELTAW
jgi:hypothetical protein